MSTPFDQVLNTIELLEQILWDLPLNELLRVRQVSRIWREVAMRSKQVKDVQEKPHINLRFQPSLFRTFSANCYIETKVEVELILWHDKPMTFGLFGGCGLSALSTSSRSKQGTIGQGGVTSVVVNTTNMLIWELAPATSFEIPPPCIREYRFAHTGVCTFAYPNLGLQPVEIR